MRIAILSFYSGKHDRGVETWAENLKKHLPTIQIFSGWESYNPLQWAKADVIIPTNGRFQVFLSRVVTWLAGKPLVVFGHSGPGADDKLNLWCSPNVFVAFSQFQKEWAEKYKLPWTKIELINHAVDTFVFSPDTRIKKTIDVLCVAANTPDKRVDLVSRAAGGLSLRIVGFGQLDQVPFAQMPMIYNQARVLCFVPQPWEAFGLVFLEAMACNLPVVTRDDPVRREIMRDAGVFVKKPENIVELAEAIELALKTGWKDIPRQRALKFSWDKIAFQYEKLFNSL